MEGTKETTATQAHENCPNYIHIMRGSRKFLNFSTELALEGIKDLSLVKKCSQITREFVFI
jgi:hypothetical protein